MALVHDHTALLSDYNRYPDAPSARPEILSFSFHDATPAFGYDATYPFVSPLDAGFRDIVRNALKMWEDVSGLTFVETKAHMGDIHFGIYDLSSAWAGDGTYPLQAAYLDGPGFKVFTGDLEKSQGRVRFDDGFAGGASNTAKLLVAAHEIGHALGLSHTFDGANHTDGHHDDHDFSVMSYSGDWNGNLGPWDVEMIQALYGTPSTPDPFNMRWDAASETKFMTGTSANEYIAGTRARDIVDARQGGEDAIATFSGDDIVYLNGGNASVNLGAGMDFVVQPGVQSPQEARDLYIDPDFDLAVLYMDDGSVQHISNAERIVFEDRTLALDVDGVAGTAHRLYEAIFNRQPDEPGLGYWVDRLESNMDVQRVAESFLRSEEFNRNVGDIDQMSNAEFVDMLYFNVLDRDGDAGGVAYWNSELDTGVSNRWVAAASFGDSAENKLNQAPYTDDGMWMTS